MNDETGSHPEARTPSGDAAATPEAARHRPMTRRAWLALMAAAGLGTGVAAYLRLRPDGTEGIVVHARARELPPLTFTDENGASTSLAAFRGRVVLLNVWATWCPPCRKEMPTLDRLQAALGGLNFEVVTLSIDSGGLPVVQTFFQQIGIKHLHPYLDTSQAATGLAMGGIPLTLLIDREGREVARKLGPAEWDSPQMIQWIRQYLPAAAADVAVTDAWALPTVPGQPVAGAYLSITSAHGATLTRVQSDAAGAVQAHEMSQDGDVMRMREVERLALPAGKTVRLAPGGTHLMLLQLKKPLRPGDSVTLDLTVVDEAGAQRVVRAIVPVKATPPQGAKP